MMRMHHRATSMCKNNNAYYELLTLQLAHYNDPTTDPLHLNLNARRLYQIRRFP